MPELVRDDASGESEGVADLMQVIAKLNHERYLASWARQEPPIGKQRIEEAEEAQAVNEIADEGVDGDHAFGFEFAERDMNGPPIGAGGTQAVRG